MSMQPETMQNDLNNHGKNYDCFMTLKNLCQNIKNSPIGYKYKNSKLIFT